MNFIKTSKFSVKGIDTTRYISSEARNLLFNRKGKLTPFELSPERFKFFLGRVGGGLCPPPLKGGDPSERHFGVTAGLETPRRLRSSE